MNTAPLSFQIKTMSAQLLVADLDRSLDFYTKKLGFDIDFRHEDFYAGIVRQGCSIHLKQGAAVKEERENKKRHHHLDIYFSVEGIDALYEDIKKLEIEIVQPLRDASYGREFYIIDPDDYMIGFLE